MRRLDGAALLMVLAGCGGGGDVDAGAADAFVPRDARTDALAPRPDGGVDAGPAPIRELSLDWVTRVASTQTLGGVAEARIAPSLGDGFVLSLTTGGAPARFAADEPEEREVGDATTPVTQAGAWYDGAGTLLHARALATAEVSDFAALGYALATLPDGRALFGGRFVASGRFGATDPNRVLLSTTVEMPDAMTTLTAAEGYLAELGADRRVTTVRTVESDRGTDDHRVVDLATLPDGAVIALGLFTGTASIETTTLTPSPLAMGEVFVARWDPDGSLAFVTRLRGQSVPTRLAVFADGSFVTLVRYAQALTVGAGEANERTLPEPPDGTLAWDAVVRYEADGALRWIRPVGGDATTYPGLRDVRVHDDGSVTVAGSFRGMTAWPDAPETAPLLIFGVDGVVARLDADGALLHQQRIRALRNLVVQALEPAGADDTWLALAISAEGATFEPAEGPPLVLPESSANARLVLLRYDGAGALGAAQHLGTTDVDADDLLRLPSGDLVLVGRHGEGTVLEPGGPAELALPPADAERNIFIARLRLTGGS